VPNEALTKLIALKNSRPEYQAMQDRDFIDAYYEKNYKGKVDRAGFFKGLGIDTPGYLKSLAGAVEQGVTFGFADEVGAAGGATGAALRNMLSGEAPQMGEAYDRILSEKRSDLKAFQEQAPIASTLAEFTGGFATAPAKLATSLVKQTLPQTIKTGAATGAGYGGLAGIGHAEGGAAERVEGGLFGAGAGGALGALLPIAIVAAGKVGGKVADFAGLRNVEESAKNQILRAMERDNITPEDALVRYNNWRMRGAKPEALFELGGENLKGLARAAYSIPSAARQEATELLRTRQEGPQIDVGGVPVRMGGGQSTRVAADLKTALGQTGEELYPTMQAIITKRAQDAAPLYDEAYLSVNVTNETLDALIKRPSMKAALARAYRIAAEEGRDPADLGISWDQLTGEANLVKTPSMQTWDYVKRGLDDVIEQYRDPVTGRLRLDESGRAIDATRTAMRNELRQLVPVYGKALDAYSGPSQSLDAMAFGRNIFSPDAELSTARVAGMSDADKDFFRLGVVRAIQDRIDSAPDGADVVKRFFNKEAFRDKVKAAFPNAASFNQFLMSIGREQQMYSAAQFVRGGSPTARIEAEKADMSTDPSMLGALMTGDLRGAGGQLANTILRRSQGMTSATADELAPMLFSADPNVVRLTLANLIAQSAGSSTSGAMRGLLAGGITRPAALLTGGVLAPRE
jgi:hypothetical protein